jgi:FKBP-type peptidyl-prolyl cis-trans isomerase
MAKDTKFKFEEIEVGKGGEVHSGDYIRIHYLGTLENGQKFDSSYDRGVPFKTRIGVGEVIDGWDMGVIGMKIGGKRKLIIPPALAYGERAVGDIPAGSTLIFEVELLGIE